MIGDNSYISKYAFIPSRTLLPRRLRLPYLLQRYVRDVLYTNKRFHVFFCPPVYVLTGRLVKLVADSENGSDVDDDGSPIIAPGAVDESRKEPAKSDDDMIDIGQ